MKKINDIYILVPCYTIVIANIFWDNQISNILGNYTVITLLFLAVFGIILTSFIKGKKESLYVAPSISLLISGYFSLVMLILLLLIHILHFPFKTIPPIIAYIFWLSIGMEVGCYWSSKVMEKKYGKKY